MSDLDNYSSRKIANIITNYLIAKNVDGRTGELFSCALKTLKLSNTPLDAHLWRAIISYPFLLSFIDAGIPFLCTASNLRKQIFLMMALLEASPYYCDYFLPKSYPIYYVLVPPLLFIDFAIRSVIGICLIYVIKGLCR